jgi:predicted MFS family arabinose efflux permease
VSHTRLLGWGLLLLIAADVLLATSNSGWVFWLGVGLWGLHMAMTQGLLATMVADTAPADLRGTAYGFFNLLSGVALLIASGLAGWLWQSFGASFTFMAGIGFAALALALLALQPRGLPV